jgi:sulfur relay (sulfurtransferase) DsrF/TusC family protein
VPTPRLTAAARRLLGVSLDSFEKLEISIALHRTAAHTLSVPELCTRLKLSSRVVDRGIDELTHAGVVRLADGAVRLTLDAQDVPAMDEIAALYDEDRLLVVRALTEIAMEKSRGMTARAFADAFQLRKKKEDDDGA